MGKPLTTLLLFSCVLFSLCASSFAQTCKSYTGFSNNKLYSSCQDLPVLNSYLHWTYDQSSSQVDIAYRVTGTSSSRWISWALNPNGQGMVGAQALVAFQNSSGGMSAYTSPVSSYSISTLTEGPLSFAVSNLSATFENSNEMFIFATLTLDSGKTTVNQVWQEGPLNGNNPSSHNTASSSNNMRSTGTVNFLDATATTPSGVVIPRLRKKNIHGVLNAVSWGVLMPMGAVIARYLKVFKSADPAWFYLHVACQTSAYIVGVAGFATGIKLGSDSTAITYDTHRNIGIVLFCMGTLQVFALLLRPKKDHKYRLYWNIYHHSIGYAVIILSIVNVFEGFDILSPDGKWKKIYIGILIFLGVSAAILEAFTWFIVIKRKNTSSVKYPSHGNGLNGANGYGARTENGV
ncbi:cytochrome b561 and DOMON domain-containing protein At5g47530-like [Juglans microcarpa x Juglans regia]|uniref:cytochrome b561 and DOMON domain-containing protein At5g47530-like n=1 Tax=Juglans microcarpa x Juglans regia TaxID=2249226 RepID=UPI001B7F2930|nr:cytochrome b561 and DOMON domain-containing protein At5g47530-like [Juglans microcarpa x Juglans regia]